MHICIAYIYIYIDNNHHHHHIVINTYDNDNNNNNDNNDDNNVPCRGIPEGASVLRRPRSRARSKSSDYIRLCYITLHYII